jgi:hypothetical protein
MMGVHILFHKSFQGRFFLAFLFAQILSSTGWSAPVPGAGSSALVDPEKGLFWKRQGFSINTARTGWLLEGPSGEDLAVRYSPADSSTGSLMVRTEQLKADLKLENYTKRWIKDYLSYGFEVLGTQTFYQNNDRALVIDLLHRTSQQQLRQVLFLKNKRAVTLTCRDRQKSFQTTLIGCNQISKTFQWAETSRPTAF